MPYHSTLNGFCSLPCRSFAVLASGLSTAATGQLAPAGSSLWPIQEGIQLQLASTATPSAAAIAAPFGNRRPSKRSCRCARATEVDLQAIMRPVAKRLTLGGLATAEPNLPGFLGGVQNRGQAGVLVRAVAKRLAFAAPARAPEIALAGFDGDAVRRVLRWNRSVHLSSPPSPLLLCARNSARPPGRARLYASLARQTSRVGGREAADGGLHRNRRRRAAHLYQRLRHRRSAVVQGHRRRGRE